MDEKVITVEALRRTYGSTRSAAGFDAVRGVDLHVERGELYALLGTNGAGKTSLLEVVEGLAPATAGSVRVLGRDPRADRAALRPHTGIMLQEAGFPPELRVTELLRTWSRTLTRPRDVGTVLGEVGLSHRADVAVKSLSGGERRRLDLALAILGRPTVLFLDEPTTGLDPESRRASWDLIRGMVDDGLTVVMTTHYLEEAEALADRIGIMHEGRLVREGTAAQIVADEPARISFALPPGTPALPALYGRHRVRTGHREVRHTVSTERLQADLHRLLNWAEEHQVTLEHLDARMASLEQAFLAIAGRGRTAAGDSGQAGTQLAGADQAGPELAGADQAGPELADTGPADTDQTIEARI